MLICGCLRILASSRIARYDLGRQTPHFQGGSVIDIHVVRQFLDAFPNDLLGIPLDRGIVFKIKLQPGSAPIAKNLYWMLPMEMKELKIQLQGLLDKDYICPSTSPWGCLSGIVFVNV
jgi:hypothetical protein